MPKKEKKPYTLLIDPETEKTLEELRVQFRKKNKAEVLRLALAVLQVSADAETSGQKMVITDGKSRVLKEIIFL